MNWGVQFYGSFIFVLSRQHCILPSLDQWRCTIFPSFLNRKLYPSKWKKIARKEDGIPALWFCQVLMPSICFLPLPSFNSWKSFIQFRLFKEAMFPIMDAFKCPTKYSPVNGSTDFLVSSEEDRKSQIKPTFRRTNILLSVFVHSLLVFFNFWFFSKVCQKHCSLRTEYRDLEECKIYISIKIIHQDERTMHL